MSGTFLEIYASTPQDQRAAVLAAAEPLHRQLRPKIPAPYADYLETMFAEGVRMTVLSDCDGPKALAVWRIMTTTFQGRRFYVDDLVTDQTRRSEGHGGKLLSHLQERANSLGCDYFTLDSGTHRHDAHRFYFRSGLVISSFSFQKALSGQYI